MLNKFNNQEEMYEYYRKNYSPFIAKKRGYGTIEWKHWLYLFSDKPTDILLKSKRNLTIISITILLLLFNKFEIEKLSFMGIVFKYEEVTLYNILLWILVYLIFMHIVISTNDFVEKSLIRYRYYHKNYFNFDEYKKYDNDLHEQAEFIINRQMTESKTFSFTEISNTIKNYMDLQIEIQSMKDKLRDMKADKHDYKWIVKDDIEINTSFLKFENTMYRKELFALMYYLILYFLPLLLGFISLFFLFKKLSII